MCSTSATRPLLYSGLLGLSVARSTCFAAAGSEMTRKLDAGPATQHMVWQEQGHNRLHIRACAAPLWHVNARPVAPFRFKHMLVSQHHSDAPQRPNCCALPFYVAKQGTSISGLLRTDLWAGGRLGPCPPSTCTAPGTARRPADPVSPPASHPQWGHPAWFAAYQHRALSMERARISSPSRSTLASDIPCCDRTTMTAHVDPALISVDSDTIAQIGQS